MKTLSNEHLNKTSNNSTRRMGGVADYFTILGIGSKLELKKSSNKNYTSTTNHKHGSDIEHDNEVALQEEECAMVERFYREIVEMCIYTVYLDEDRTYYLGASLATSLTEEQHELIEINHRTSKGKLLNLHLANQEKKVPSDVSGFSLILQTLPLGSSSNDTTHSSQHALDTNFSFMDHDTTINNSMSLSMNTTFESKHGGPLWKKYDTFQADISPMTGIRCTLQSMLKMEDLMNMSMSFTQSFDGSHHQDSSFESKTHTNQSESKSKHKPSSAGGRFSHLTKHMNVAGISKLRDQLSPLLLTTTTTTATTPTKTTSNKNKGDGKRLHDSQMIPTKQFYIGYRRRGPDESDKPGIADVTLLYCRIHKSTIIQPELERYIPPLQDEKTIENEQDAQRLSRIQNAQKGAAVLKRGLVTGADLAKRVASTGGKRIFGKKDDSYDSELCCQENDTSNNMASELSTVEIQKKSNIVEYDQVSLKDFIEVPVGYDQMIIPDMYQTIQLPVPPSPTKSKSPSRSPIRKSPKRKDSQNLSSGEKRMQKTFLFNANKDDLTPRDAGIGVEAFVDGKTFLHPSPRSKGSPSRVKLRKNPWSPVESIPVVDEFSNFDESDDNIEITHVDHESLLPTLVPIETLPNIYDEMDRNDGGDYEYIPIIAIRRQRFSEEERFHEDPSIVELGLTFTNFVGKPVFPIDDEEDEFGEDCCDDPLLKTSGWSDSVYVAQDSERNEDGSHDDEIDNEEDQDERKEDIRAFALPKVMCKRNSPIGFLDTPFATRVLDRFPKKDYKGVPLPEEELPMFCYPTGCRLIQAKYQDAPLPEYYGFTVKNERGDNIYVSCVSFMEPLERSKLDQLNAISQRRRRTSLPHKIFCERLEHQKNEKRGRDETSTNHLIGFESMKNDTFLMGFEEVLTFEKKTICLISRYPFWSAFRQFLSHLHILSGSSSELPLERYISHLLLSVPLPKPGHQYILIPLPAIASPMVLGLPPVKDLPLVDIPFRRLFSSLDVPTVVTIVFGFLALERKVIIMSAIPSMVSDVCELLRSLLFPFELCAPYVPRLTEPFMSCLNFPGAIFVGIHDDGSHDGLAANVKRNIPDEAFIVDLDTGDIDCGGERFEVLKECWDIIPHQVRSLLVEEVETLCDDANINPGQEPYDIGIETTLDFSDVSFAPMFGEDAIEPLDDRAVRDAFLRCFCSILGGYERFLLVPDIDFLVSGNEWFDTKGFIAATEKQNRGPFLQSLTATQMFQSFIQRRTESGDVYCLLFDECLAEFHSSQSPYGRLASFEPVKKDRGNNYPPYELLIDQCATELSTKSDVDELSSAEISILTVHTIDGFMVNSSGDLVTAPSKKNLPSGNRYVYCEGGHPHFPQELDTKLFYPEEPNQLTAEFGEVPVPILTRSDRELDDSNRRRKIAISHRGVQRQRRCLFQLPKLMASQFLNTWLMCIPSQVSQSFQFQEQQITYLLRALGALRLLRSQHRIVPDEAGYRCLIMACGRVQSDRRQDIVKLFGLMRSDGIFPSAVTLGQYTRAIAEGYSKQSSGKANSIISESFAQSSNLQGDGLLEKILNLDVPNALDFLDGSLIDLDEIGSRWRQTRETEKYRKLKLSGDVDRDSDKTQKAEAIYRSKRKNHNNWLPVSCSSSFSPHWEPAKPINEAFDILKDFNCVALWSRTTQCTRCGYVLLDEEIQAGWDDIDVDSHQNSNDIKCPCCDQMITPLLGYMEISPSSGYYQSKEPKSAFNAELPPQVQSTLSSDSSNDDRLGFVPYLSPSKMRLQLERIVEDIGEEILDREKLRYFNPSVFFNLWWYCSRFSLPLPLSISARVHNSSSIDSPVYNSNCCAFASWEKSTAIAACNSAIKSLTRLQNLIRKRSRPKSAPAFNNLVHLFNSADSPQESSEMSLNPLECPLPLLANMTLSSIGDWDNTELSLILLKLLDACDKRDFLPAVEAVMKCNADRKAQLGRSEHSELECYRTLLYLSRYQCTAAFHTFFPPTSKVCKGYHFWCPNTTISLFDRMFRDAIDRLRAQDNVNSSIHDVSDIALGFRSVFGHIV